MLIWPHRLKALDLFCCAGGATRGLQAAGFHVHGVDISHQPRYCGDAFTRADALTVGDAAWYQQFDLVWASPPCQRFTPGAAKWGTHNSHPNLIAKTRERLQAMNIPFVIENVPTTLAHLENPIMLCGTMFNLGVFRHRLFESTFPIVQPPHTVHTGRIGDGKYHTVTGHAGGSSKRDGWKNGGVFAWRSAMRISWMIGNELVEAIPPAFSFYVARQFLQAVAHG